MRHHIGNVLDVKSGIIVHGCNACGVMGSGVAFAVKQRYPAAYLAYMRQCASPAMLGSISYTSPSPGLLIVNAITQESFGRDGRRYVNYEAVADAFACVRKLASLQEEAPAIHFPMIGAGLGGGLWHIIAAIIEAELPNFSLNLWTLE